MFISHERQKLINAIIFFTRNTERCHTLKLFKLLNFLDFETYRQTGRTVTGQRYVAWPEGPAPAALWREFHDPQNDLARAIAVNWIKDDITGTPIRRDIKAKAEFDSRFFTKRELRIMRLLAEIFKEADGGNMSRFSHEKGLPWEKVYASGKGKGREISYDLAVESTPVLPTMPGLSKDEIERRKEEFKEIEEATSR